MFLLRFHHSIISTDNCFSLRVHSQTLCAQWTCHVLRTRLSRTPVSRITCHWLVYSYVPVPVLRVSSYLYRCTDMDSRLVSGYLFISRFPFCVVDSYTYVTRLHLSRFISSTHLYAYHYCLCLSFCSLSTRLPSRYFWTLTRHRVVFPFLYLCTCISRTAIYTGWRCGLVPHLQSTLQPP